jgi:hypothetical protein
VHWRRGLPRPPGQGWVARRPPVPKGHHDSHRPAACCCYTPVPPRWCSRPCPDAPANACTVRPGMWPVLCAPPKGPRATVVGGVARACLRTSPGKRRLPAARRSHPAGTHDPDGGAPWPRCPCPPVSAEGPARGRLAPPAHAGGRYHTGHRPGAPRGCGQSALSLVSSARVRGATASTPWPATRGTGNCRSAGKPKSVGRYPGPDPGAAKPPVDWDPPGEHGQAQRGDDCQDPQRGPALCAGVRQQMDHAEHHAGQGEQDMPHDDRRGQPAGGGTLAGNVVFDEPDSQQVQPKNVVTSQLINAATPISPPIPAHTGPRPRSPGRKDPAARHGRIRPDVSPQGRHHSHQPETLSPVTRPAHGVAGCTPAGRRDGCTTPPDARPGPPARSRAASAAGQRQSR